MKKRLRRQPHLSLVDITILIGLTFAALLPRIILALRLDIVSDELVYIQAAKKYFPLLEHLKIGAKGWSFNYEQPPLVKLFIGLALYLNTILAHPLAELQAARIPSIIMGTVLVVAIYWLGHAIVGRVVALLAALCLAFSPWLAFFSAIAYLDIPMTTLITLAYLLIWYAPRRPVLYPLAAALLGLGAASKYPAVLIIPCMILFTAHYFFLIRPRLPVEQRPSIPWGWWASAIIVAPLTFLVANPAIWPSPYHLLIHSFTFEWKHAVNGHLTFIDGQANWHAPHWAIPFILLVKMSLLVTIPAAIIICYTLIQLIQFHLYHTKIEIADVTTFSFLLIWLVGIIGMFCLFTIVVGTNYALPAVPPVALAGAYGLTKFLGYRRGQLFSSSSPEIAPLKSSPLRPHKLGLQPYTVTSVTLLTLMLAVPHLIGLISVSDADGYSNELFRGENRVLQGSYIGYHDALQWLNQHTHGKASVGFVTIWNTGIDLWYHYNKNFSTHYRLAPVYPGTLIPSYKYLIFPINLVQRGITIPPQYHIIHVISGGSTIYCYVTAHT